MTFCLSCGSCGGTTGSNAGNHHDVDVGAAGQGGAQQGAPAGAGGTQNEGGSSGAGGGYTALDVATFQATGCVDASSSLPPWLTGLDREEYAGLQCIAWEANSDRLLLDLANFEEDKGFPNPEDNLWLGEAAQRDDGTLRLRVEWDFDYQNTGGGCLEDFSFAIDDVDVKGTLALEIATRPCTGTCPWTEYALTLPVGSTPSGIACRYANQMSATPPEDSLGSLHRPPVDGECNDGLAVLETPFGDVCAQQCSGDGVECPLPDLLTCKDSLCVIAEPW